ncbi:hypothetical protein C1E24_10480 [Pseudoalteromonas phenolica]|uniref:Uncharacterized protein n=1 Tax=Pseudoalteromonas phenolica TaxID=161398 RepID=A0A5R9Q4N6_9GAMM|nr:hypothetical protein [Pseudoalteromonas phenolica]TLX47219.1 hypothetical protein C1E24_10480 [Pseudoalteromonas phenolica]
MITVTQLSRNYPSTWRKTFPFLNRLVKKCNLQKETFDDGIFSTSEPTRRALINETGFYLYKKMMESQINKTNDLTQEVITEVANTAFSYIKNLDFNPEQLAPLSEEEINESKLIAGNLFHYFFYYEKGKSITISPHFSGCGLVSDCYGDILAGTTLYEVKSGERDFRIADLKQILIYLTLNYSLHQNSINQIGLINPRLGNYIVLSVKDAIELASGQSTVDCFNELINFFDSPDDFR